MAYPRTTLGTGLAHCGAVAGGGPGVALDFFTAVYAMRADHACVDTWLAG